MKAAVRGLAGVTRDAEELAGRSVRLKAVHGEGCAGSGNELWAKINLLAAEKVGVIVIEVPHLGLANAAHLCAFVCSAYGGRVTTLTGELAASRDGASGREVFVNLAVYLAGGAYAQRVLTKAEGRLRERIDALQLAGD
jgi:hypothetical protein